MTEVIKIKKIYVAKTEKKTIIYDSQKNTIYTGNIEIYNLLHKIKNLPKFSCNLQIPHKDCKNSYNVYEVIFICGKNIGYTIEIKEKFFRMKKFYEYKKSGQYVEIISDYKEFKFDLEINNLVLDDFLESNNILMAIRTKEEYFNISNRMSNKNIVWNDNTPILNFIPKFDLFNDIILVLGKDDIGLMYTTSRGLSYIYKNDIDLYAKKTKKIITRLYHFADML